MSAEHSLKASFRAREKVTEPLLPDRGPFLREVATCRLPGALMGCSERQAI